MSYQQNISNYCSEAIKAVLKEESHTNNESGDAIWILTSAFIIFTMQSGFGLLEAGSASTKNECNIMVKNAVDVIFGGLGYWICGFGFSFGGNDKLPGNGFTGYGNFLTDSVDDDFGSLYAKYFFQLSFATTATTIVSGAMAERTNLKAYMFFSFLNFTSYVFPAHWIWDPRGFLHKMKAVDVAGCGPVHLVGGTSSLVATLMLKPRYKAFSNSSTSRSISSPTNVVLGTFMLWWGWLGFNCGSTFGVSGGRWKLASRAAVATVNASVGSGLWSVAYSFWLTKDFRGKLDISTLTSGILGGLVSITGICALCKPWEALVIGIIGGMITTYGMKLIKILKIDDPVECVSVHGFCGMWGLIAIGIFAEKNEADPRHTDFGVLKGGPWKFLAVQSLAVLCIVTWAATTCAIQLLITDKLLGLRMTLEDEIVGADLTEHGINHETGEMHSMYGSIKRLVYASSMIAQLNPDTNTTEENPISNHESSDKKNINSFCKQGILNYGFLTINNERSRKHTMKDASPISTMKDFTSCNHNTRESPKYDIILVRSKSVPNVSFNLPNENEK